MAGVLIVTGGAGFVGSHVAARLLEAGHGMRVGDALLPAAHDGRPPGMPDGAEVLVGDLRDPAVAHAAVRGVTGISHQPAIMEERMAEFATGALRAPAARG